MTLTELRYIVTLAAEKHFGRAAEKCHVSQPTLSIGVKRLEEELGVTLFERHKGQVLVTGQGVALVRQAETVLFQAQKMWDLAEQGKQPWNHTLRMGAIYTIGPYLFPHLMPLIHSEVPELPLYIEESYTAVLREKLKSAELDAIVIALPFDEPEVNTQALYDEPFVVLLPADHPLCEYDAIQPEQLEAENVLLLGPGHCFRDQVLAACPGLLANTSLSDENRQHRPVITEGSSLETIRHMVAGGMGITILPLSAAIARHGGDLLQVRPFVSPQPYRTVALATRTSFSRKEAVDMLATTIKKVVRKETLQPDISANTGLSVYDES